MISGYDKIKAYRNSEVFIIMNNSQTASNSLKIRRLAVAGLFTALVYVFTAYLHIPTGAGYTHAGDGIIFLSASILPTPYAMAVGAIGGAMADGLSGFAIWIPATVIIKAVTAMFFSNKSEKILTRRNLLAIIPSLILCVVGYSLYQGTVMAGGISWTAITAAFAQTPAYCIQIAVSTALYVAVGIALDKINFKKRMF